LIFFAKKIKNQILLSLPPFHGATHSADFGDFSKKRIFEVKKRLNVNQLKKNQENE
jgi:hypothetical protein